jgi:hypothetical protein
MQSRKKSLIFKCLTLTAVMIMAIKVNSSFSQTGINDTLVHTAVVYNGDTMEAKTLLPVYLVARLSSANLNAYARWTRLRNAIYVTYPYARRAGAVMNDMSAKLVNITEKSARRAYIKSREKELKKEFADPLTQLSVYQGKVLMKLIYRETNDNCYEIIKEYKGGLTARFWQTVAFFFGSNLKQYYDARGEDAEMEKIVLEVQRMYGFKS